MLVALALALPLLLAGCLQDDTRPSGFAADVTLAERSRAEHASPAWGPALARWAAAVGQDDTAAAAALAEVRATPGLRPDRIFMWPPSAVPIAELSKALVANDAAALDHALAPLADLLPFARDGVLLYRAVADWMRVHGSPPLADAWAARAARVEASFAGDPARTWASLSRTTTFAWAVVWALPLFALVVGVGLGARQRGRGPAGPGVLHWIGVLVLAFVGVLTFAMLGGQRDTLRKHATIPAAFLLDEARTDAEGLRTFASADVRTEVRGGFLKYVDAEAAVPAGAHSEAIPPADTTMRQILGPSRGFLDRAGASAAGLSLHSVLAPGVWAPATLLIALMIVVTAIGVGGVLGHRWPRLWSAARLVPGASRWLGPLGGVILMMVLAGGAALVAGRELGGAVPHLSFTAGHDVTAARALAAGWAPAALGLGLGLHLLGLWLDRRGARALAAATAPAAKPGVDSPADAR